MKLIVGGACQGKLDWAGEHCPEISPGEWIDGKTCGLDEIYCCRGMYNFQEYIRRLMLERPEQAQGLADEMIRRNPEAVIISCEIGYGLVPVDAFERKYREQTGRICTELAAFSDEVIRVVMGIGTVIKRNPGTGKTEPGTKPARVMPHEIERRSFEMIEEELGAYTFTPETKPVVMRCIHTSADFDYAENLIFSENAVKNALHALKEGAVIVTDTQMAKAGINKKKLASFGGQIQCFMSDEDVAEEAGRRGITRAAVSMERAAKLSGPLIFAIGNAPTALCRLYELVQEGAVKPELIIGVPVGFVNVVQSKELILTLKDTPYIAARGRKGGSNIAACICNALLYML